MSLSNNCIQLFDKKKVRILTVCILYLLAVIFGCCIFFSDFNYFIECISASVFLFMLIFGGYVFLYTEDKLIISNMYIGLGFSIISITLYISFFVYNSNKALIMFLAYLIFMIVNGIIIYKKRFFSFKKRSKEYRKNTLIFYMFAYMLGGIVYRFGLKNSSLENVVYSFSFFLITYLCMFMGLMMITKFFYIIKYKDTGTLYFDYV